MTQNDINILKMIASNCDIPKCQRDMLTEIIEKEEKYAWHDLRKNPDDLPCHSKYVLCVYWDGKKYNYRLCTSKKNMGFKHVKYSTILAWREIEPFREEGVTNEKET